MKLSSLPLIILAAGKSSRMGFPKGLMIYQGKKLLQYQIENFFSLGGKKVVVVLGEHRERYLSEISALKNCELVYNDKVDWGPYYSIQLALAQLEYELGAFLLPMDTPGANPSVWKNLARSHRSELYVTQPSFQERGGHPIIIGQKFFPELLSVDPESEEGRLDLQIKKLSQDKIKRIPVRDSRIRLNINTLS